MLVSRKPRSKRASGENNAQYQSEDLVKAGGKHRQQAPGAM